MSIEARVRQQLDPIIRDSHLMVLEAVKEGKDLDWLERSVLKSLLDGELRYCDEVAVKVQEMRKSGEL